MTSPAFIFSDFIAGFWRIDSWNMSPQQRLDLIEHYLELGVTSMDHADIYGVYRCEALFGEALALKPQLRQQMQLISKCGIKPEFNGYESRYVNHYDTSKNHIIKSVENSLNRLKTDYLDVLLIHRPDPLMNADEIAETFEQLHAQGKVRHFGVSNFTTNQFNLLQSRLHAPLITNQIELSPLAMQSLHDGVLDQCQQHRITPMAWSCLGGGELLSANTSQALRIRNTLHDVAQQVGTEHISQVIYAWVRMHPSCPAPIIGSGNRERITSAVNSANIHLDRQQWFSIWQAAMGHAVP